MKDGIKSPKELYDYRVKLYRDAMSFKKPNRTPICGNMFTWMFNDAGYSANIAARNYDIIEECMIRFIKDYKVDEVNVLNSGFRNPFLVSDSLGGSTSYTDHNADGLNAIIENLMHVDEYDDFIKDYNKAIWEKAFPRRYPNLANMTPQQIAQAAKTAPDHFAAKTKTNTVLREEYGILTEINGYYYTPAFEDLFCNLRGIKAISTDLRRQPNKVLEFCETRDALAYSGFKTWIENQPSGPDMTEPLDVCMWPLGHTILNLKQFEKYYWPLVEKTLRDCEAKGKQVVFWSEGSWERFGDFFNGFNKGVVTMMVEQDDPYEIRKKFPNICIMGGIERDLLSSGTPQQNVDAVKRAIDELGYEGGLILQPNKMISFANDMQPENFKAICEFVSEYR